MTVAFIICTEEPFEKKSVLLARSIRTFAGGLRDAPIYSFSPRAGQRVSEWALRQFASLSVTHDTTMLNHCFTQFGVNNKPFVCAYAERAINAEVLIFLDSDKI